MDNEYAKLAGEYDAVFVGTGPVESLASAALSRAGKKVLHLDRSQDYGSCRLTYGLNAFIEYCQKNGAIPIDRTANMLPQPIRSSAYSLDLMPFSIFSKDEIIKVLINSGSSDMVQVQLIDGLYFRGDTSFILIPFSRSAIFSEKSFTLKQKRSIMKFVSFFFSGLSYGHSEDITSTTQLINEYEQKPFHEFLIRIGFDDNLCGAFEYFLARESDPLTTAEAIKRIHQFTDSIGVHGPTPLLTFLYGSSELPQIFCRNSAVYGSVFAMGIAPQTATKTEKGFSLNVDKVGSVSTQHLVLSADQIGEDSEKKLIAYREVLLTKEAILPQGRSIAVIAPGKMGNTAPVYILQFDSSLRVCADGVFVIHFASMGEISGVVDQLISGIDQNVVLRAQFVLKESKKCSIDGALFVESPSVGELSMGSDYFVEKAKEIIAKIDPSIPFFPAPTEVEVDVEPEEVEEAKTSDTTPKAEENTPKPNDASHKAPSETLQKEASPSTQPNEASPSAQPKEAESSQ